MKLEHPFDLAAVDAVRLARADPKEAQNALLIAASYIRSGESLPMGLAEWLADAIETAIRKPARLDPYNADPAAALLFALHLKARNRRPAKVIGYMVHNYMMCLIDGDQQKAISQNNAAKKAARKFDISVSTANLLYRKWEETYKEVEADMKANPDNYR